MSILCFLFVFSVFLLGIVSWGQRESCRCVFYCYRFCVGYSYFHVEDLVPQFLSGLITRPQDGPDESDTRYLGSLVMCARAVGGQ